MTTCFHVSDLGLTGSQVWPQLDSFAQAAGFTRPYLTMSAPVDVSDEYKAKVRKWVVCNFHCLVLSSQPLDARSSLPVMVRAFAHSPMGRRIDPP